MSIVSVLLGVVAVSSVLSANAAPAAPPVNCDDPSWDLTIANYNNASTDQNLHTFWFGGVGTDGLKYYAKKAQNNFFTKSLALTVEPNGYDFVCTLEAHSCQPAPQCTDYGVLLASDVRAAPSHWGWFAVHSIANVFSFAESFMEAFSAAGTSASLLNLDLTKTFTKPSSNNELIVRDILLGFSFAVISAFIFVPVAGQILGAAAVGAVSTALTLAADTGEVAAIAAGDAGGFLGNVLSSSSSTLDIKAADFGAFMNTVFENTYSGIDSLVSQLMEGFAVNGATGDTPTILNILQGGGWVNADVVTIPAVSINDLRSLLERDLLQRGINQIWSQSKIWVTFADLQDDAQTTKCIADKNGWQASKTCADGGVYYLYRFNEAGNEKGYMTYPWGADQMANAPWSLDPSWVTRSSATAYRSQNNGTGGFNYDYTKAPTNLPSLFQALGKGSFEDLNALEGVWNISVCDMGLNSHWNTDFTQNPPTSDFGDYSFPCCCGPQCSQTGDFIASAQMNNFDTIYNKCKQYQLADCAAWPQGATEVDFGKAGTVQRSDAYNCPLSLASLGFGNPAPSP